MFLRRINLEKDLEELFTLRFNVWSEKKPFLKTFDERTLKCPFDINSFHWGVYSGATLIGGASLYRSSVLHKMPDIENYIDFFPKCDPPYYMMRRLVVSKGNRNQGCGKHLDRARIEFFLKNENHSKKGTIFSVTSNLNRVKSLSKRNFIKRCEIGDFDTSLGGSSALLVSNYNICS